MTSPAPDARPSSLHRRLTVALAAASDRSRLADAISGALAETSAGATPLRAADLLEAAGAFAAIRASDRAELRTRLEAAAGRAEEDRAAADQAVEALLARQAALHGDATWARTSEAELALRRTAVDAARVALDARASDLRNAHSSLERVLEQRAAAAAAVEEADRELGDMTSVGMDEPGLRRELEIAVRSVRDTTVALQTATEALEHLRAEEAELLAELATAREGDTADASPESVTAAQIERVLDAYDAFRSAVQSSLSNRADPAALDLAQAWQDLAADFSEAGADAAPGPSEEAVRAAEDELAAATAALNDLEAHIQSRVLTVEQRAAIDAAHAAVLAAEERTGRRLGAGSAKARLDQARDAERALLDQHGFDSYLQVMLTGGRVSNQDAELAEAERRYLAASAALDGLRHSATSPALAYLETERERLRQHTIDLIGVDPGDVAVELLEAHVTVPGGLVDELRAALEGVEVQPVGIALTEAAETWLGTQHAAAEQQMALAADQAGTAGRLAQLEARREEISGLLDAGRRRVDEAAEKLELAQRSVDALEAELTVRTGEDTKRLKRLAAAEQLRAQVDTLQASLASAEEAARAALDAAMSDHAAAEVAFEQANAAIAELARRCHTLAEQLPAEQRPQGELAEVLVALASSLDALAESVQPEVNAARQTLEDATRAHDESLQAVEMASRAVDGPQRDDFVEGLAQLLGDADQRHVLVLDDPFAGVDAEARAELLALVRDGSADRQLVLLTEDPEVLGWAIELPADVGTAVPADALLARALRQPTDAPARHATDPEPATRSRRHAGRN